MHRVSRWALAVCALIALLVPLTSAASEADVRRVWQMLDYLAVDYGGAVENGKVVSPSEFAEMREFARTSRTRIAGLEPKAEQPVLVAEADALIGAIEAKGDATKVAGAAKSLASHLVAVYPIPLAPAAAPDVKLGAALYAANCASCHGSTGNGDGPAAARLDPKPIAFTDKDRARNRSVLALYQAITQGIPGTSMPAFGQLSDADRWAAAIYLGQFSHDAPQRKKGEELWRQDEAVRQKVGGLESFVRLSEAELATTLGAEHAAAVMAYLQQDPASLSKAVSGSNLTVARDRLARSAAAYEAGDAKQATDLALSSYLDGIEPFELALAARDDSLKTRLEVGMGQYRSLLAANAPLADVQRAATTITGLFTEAEQALARSKTDVSAAFFGSLTILLREGIEALLVVVAMLAFLRKAERTDMLAYVHAGWSGAIVAGSLTWAAATYLVGISGANREVTEGLSSLFAAAVLLSVGVWMHQKSVAGRWQVYLQERMSTAVTRKSAWFLFALSFIAVYREVFETILFYAAMWDQGSNAAIVLGFGAGIAALATLSVLLLRFSARLPIGQFFAASSWLVAVLAVVLTGKGIAALEEAGWIQPHAISAPRVEFLGVFPSTVGLVAQAAVITAVAVFFIRSARKPLKPTDSTPAAD